MKILLLLCITFLFLQSVHAQTFAVGERNVHISAIEGYCFYDPAFEADNAFLKAFKANGGSDLIASMLVSCSYLKEFRSYHSSFWKKYFISKPKSKAYFWTRLLASSTDEDFHDVEYVIPKLVCPELTKLKENFTVKGLENKKSESKILRELLPRKAVGMGLIESDDTHCYLGSLKKSVGENGATNTELYVYTPQIQDGMTMIHIFASPYEGYTSIEKSVSTLKEFIAAQQ